MFSVLTMTDGVGTTTYGYHPIAETSQLGLGALPQKPIQWRTAPSPMDMTGWVGSQAAAASGVVATISYDDLGRPTQVTNALCAFTFDFEGTTSRLNALGLPNGMTTAFSYFDATQQHRLKEIFVFQEASLLFDFRVFVFKPDRLRPATKTVRKGGGNVLSLGALIAE